jgi:FkbM family methyltransferase
MPSVVNARGRRIHLMPGDARAETVAAHAGAVYPHSNALWRSALEMRVWDVVVDIGANYGEMLADADLAGPAQVVAYEPSSSVLPALRQTIAELPFVVELRERAVSDTVGVAEFTIDETWSGMSSLLVGAAGDTHSVRTEEVAVTTIDADFAGSGSASICMKIDVEGHDLHVLAGARATLARASGSAVMIEILHFTPEQIAELAAEWRMYLADLGTGALVRVPGGDPAVVAEILSGGWLYRQDALLCAGDAGPAGGEGVEGVTEFARGAGAAIAARAAAPAPDPEREAALERELDAMRRTLSWRITAPIRGVRRLFGRT